MSDTRKARDLELLDAIDKFERFNFEGTVWRVVRESRDVLLASKVGARWEPGNFDVLYTSLEPNGALEEVHFHLSRQPVFPATIRFQLHRIRISVQNIMKFEMGVLRQLGVDIENFGTLDYSKTQAIGDIAFFLGCGGLLVPSARHKGENLVLFSDRVDPGDIEVEESEDVDWRVWRLQSSRST